MRTLILLRGAPGCGKSTFIERNGLKPYTLSADDIRLQYTAISYRPDGTTEVPQNINKVAWERLFEMLEYRMESGQFTVIDATNSKTQELNQYNALAKKYRYRVFCVDMTNVPIDVCKQQNAQRPPHKVVPEEAIDNMYTRFATQKIPKYITALSVEEFEAGKAYYKANDFSHYKRIHPIGDIHGCYTALMDYFDRFGFHKDELYIFCGDYVDRGLQDAEVVKFLCKIKDLPNVMLLEGNHETHLNKWAHHETSLSPVFNYKTTPQLYELNVKKDDVKALYRKLVQCVAYKYGSHKVVLVTHGGLPTFPFTRPSLTHVSTHDMIHGVGKYADGEECDKTFSEFAREKYQDFGLEFIQIHGHRNVTCAPIKSTEYTFNLEGRVEHGGCLRAVQLSKYGFVTVEIPNRVYRKTKIDVPKTGTAIVDLVDQMRHNDLIQEKKYGHISSFNFTRKAFYDRKWDAMNVKARGLFIDTEKNKIVSRSYEKFFNVNEMPETKATALQNNLCFPVCAYRKENGFLGIVGYDSKKDELFISSKTTPNGDFAGYFKTLLASSGVDMSALKSFIKENDVSFVFEVIDIDNDPHIIKYEQSKIVLLDIIKNQMEFEKLDYDELYMRAAQFGFDVKEKTHEFNGWNEFYDWYQEVMAADYTYNGEHIEGFVIEDSKGFMCKIKGEYYRQWKTLRTVTEEVRKSGGYHKTSRLYNPEMNLYFAWLRDNLGRELPDNIIALRDLFYKEKKGQEK